MACRKLIRAIAVVAPIALACAGATAADRAKYPEWKGAWERYVPPVSMVSPSGLRTPGGQPSFDQTKPWGRGQEAPLTPEYQKVLEDSIADQERRPGQQFRPRPLHAHRHAAHDDVRTAGIRRHAGHHLYLDRHAGAPHLHRRPRLARRRSSRAMRAIRSESGSTRMATATTTCWKPKRAASRARASTMPPACRCTSTISPFSRNGYYIDKADPKVIHDEITVLDHALTRPWTVDKRYVHDPKSASPTGGRASCVEGTESGRHRQGDVCPPRRRLVDAGQEGPAAAGFAIFQADSEMTPYRRCARRGYGRRRTGESDVLIRLGRKAFRG